VRGELVQGAAQDSFQMGLVAHVGQHVGQCTSRFAFAEARHQSQNNRSTYSTKLPKPSRSCARARSASTHSGATEGHLANRCRSAQQLLRQRRLRGARIARQILFSDATRSLFLPER
jgi:hypothetical protein